MPFPPVEPAPVDHPSLRILSQRLEANTPASIVLNGLYEENDCFRNAMSHVARNGGEIVLGWRVVWSPDVFVSANFHAVWRKPAGELLDVTQTSYKAKHTTFLEIVDQASELANPMGWILRENEEIELTPHPDLDRLREGYQRWRRLALKHHALRLRGVHEGLALEMLDQQVDAARNRYVDMNREVFTKA